MSRFHLGDFRDRARDFARSNHSSRRLVLPIYRPTTVNITPRRYPESPGSSRTAHGAAHGTSRRTAPIMRTWPIWTGKSVFRWLKSTLHYLPRLFPTPPYCKRAGLSPASPGSSPNLSGGAGGARAAGRARGRFRAAPRSHRGFSKTCFHGRLGARGKAHDSPPVLV